MATIRLPNSVVDEEEDGREDWVPLDQATRERQMAAAAQMVAAIRAGWRTVEGVATELEIVVATEAESDTVAALLAAVQAESEARRAWMAAALTQETRLRVHLETRVALENARMVAAAAATVERQIHESADGYRQAMAAVRAAGRVVDEKHRETLAALGAVEAELAEAPFMEEPEPAAAARAAAGWVTAQAMEATVGHDARVAEASPTPPPPPAILRVLAQSAMAAAEPAETEAATPAVTEVELRAIREEVRAKTARARVAAAEAELAVADAEYARLRAARATAAAAGAEETAEERAAIRAAETRVLSASWQGVHARQAARAEEAEAAEAAAVARAPMRVRPAEIPDAATVPSARGFFEASTGYVYPNGSANIGPTFSEPEDPRAGLLERSRASDAIMAEMQRQYVADNPDEETRFQEHLRSGTRNSIVQAMQAHLAQPPPEAEGAVFPTPVDPNGYETIEEAQVANLVSHGMPFEEALAVVQRVGEEESEPPPPAEPAERSLPPPEADAATVQSAGGFFGASRAEQARQGREILRGTRVLTAEERLEHAAHGREMLERLDALQARTAAAAARAEEAAAPTVQRVSDTAYISTARDPDGNELRHIMTERRAPRYQRAVPTQPAAAADSAAAEVESDDSEVFGAADSLADDDDDDDGAELMHPLRASDAILAEIRRRYEANNARDDADIPRGLRPVWESFRRDVLQLTSEPTSPPRRAEAAAHRAARQGLLERSIAMADIERRFAVDSNGAPPPSLLAPPPAKPTRKEDLHFLRDLIESVQEARPDVVSEGAYLRSSNLLRDLFREADAKAEPATRRARVYFATSEGVESMLRFIEQQPPLRNILAPPDEPNVVD